MKQGPPKLNPERVPLRIVGVVYQYASGRWQRYLVRRLRDGAWYWSQTYSVDPRYLFCLTCLSHRVRLQQDGTKRCECGVLYSVV